MSRNHETTERVAQVGALASLPAINKKVCEPKVNLWLDWTVQDNTATGHSTMANEINHLTQPPDHLSLAR